MAINYIRKYPIALRITVFTVIRLLIANLINLGNDEVYYFTYAVQPDWNHFDHPPLVGIFIRIFTFNLHYNSEIFVRMPGVVAGAVNTWLIAQCGMLLKNRNTGLLAALFYNSSIYTCILSGVFILPDSVQLTWWLAALWTMLKYIQATAPPDIQRYLLLTGLWIGLATMAKVHGIFLWAGFLGFILTRQPGLLKSPSLYLSLLLTATLVSPILFWNISNNFITWRFHGERVTVSKQGIDLKSFLRTAIGQVLYANPFQIALFALAGKTFISRKIFSTPDSVALLLWCSLPIIASTMFVSLFRDTLPHWSGPGFVGLMLLGAAWADGGPAFKGPARALVAGSLGLILFVFTAGPILVRCYPGTMSPKPFPETGAGDATLDINGWDQLLPAFEMLRQNDIARGSMPANAPIAIHKWFPGAHIYYHVAYPLGLRAVGVGTLEDLHQFAWLNKRYGAIQAGSDAWYITPSNNFTDPSVQYAGLFDRFEKAATIPQRRGGRIARYWFVYRLKGAKQVLGYQLSDSLSVK